MITHQYKHYLQPPLNLLWFDTVNIWSLEDCLSLLAYYLVNERAVRRGWNNNMSLVNTDPSSEDVSWSLLLWKLRRFDFAVPVVLPFKFKTDSRGIQRAYTTLPSIKSDAIVWSRQRDTVFTGSDRMIVIEALIDRICSCFGWSASSPSYYSPVYRYRLVSALDNLNLVSLAGLDVHHVNGIRQVCKKQFGRCSLDDRIKNLMIMEREDHAGFHQSQGDSNWVEL